MGLLSGGQPLSWEETKALAEHVRKHGVQQFIHLYRKLQDRRGDILKWGDEVEYNLIRLDDGDGANVGGSRGRRARLLLDAQRVLGLLQEPEVRGDKDLASLWRPEYAAYMVEGTPGAPYLGQLNLFSNLEKDMRARRKLVQDLMGPNEHVVSMSCFPRLGCPGFTYPEAEPEPETSFTRSLFWPSSATYQGHPRFKALTDNIRQRRGQKVCINVPVFVDENTVDPYEAEKDLIMGPKQEPQSRTAPKPGHIYMDAMGFGMGLSCLQITFQASCVMEAESLYDQLAPLCPIMLAFTAATPFARGYLTDRDCRWDYIAAAVDCRTKEERGEEPLKNNKHRIPKSRYDSISSYLTSKCQKFPFNDVDLVKDEQTLKTLLDAGIPELMANHVAHLFIRDTVSMFSERIHQNDEEDTDHFENIQSTNWQTMRFKPPPPNSEIGWRVEFRPCELQFTDFENAAICCFVVLLTRVILSFNYDMLIPISKVDENMRRAQKRDAALKEKFHFRSNITPRCQPGGKVDECNAYIPVIEEMTIDEIFNGSKEKNFQGLIQLVTEYLNTVEVNASTMCTLTKYLDFLSKKASGKVRTNARFMRDFVVTHPSYNKDSIVTEEIQHDLIKHILDITENAHNDKRLKEVLGF